MKTSITVKDRNEAHAVKTAMEDAQVRAFVIVMGTLLQLPSDRARARVLAFVHDHVTDPDITEQVIPQ